MAKRAPKRAATDEHSSSNVSDPSMAAKGAKRTATEKQIGNTSGRSIVRKAAKRAAVDEQSNGKIGRKEPERKVKNEEKPSNGFTSPCDLLAESRIGFALTFCSSDSFILPHNKASSLKRRSSIFIEIYATLVISGEKLKLMGL
ncbi:unnamed protein product [Cylicostephanus goldi]|uniref:Uncharacterized protein n=1 Tax=Cylicostephanus goldi TaxID=71465 RepID=A0A3P6R7E7_CYLGO|nr:unnamed protein product [Cylicostephanus goldi]